MSNSEVIPILTAFSIALLIAGLLAWKWQLGLGRCTVFTGICASGFGPITVGLAPRMHLGRFIQVMTIVLLTAMTCLVVLLFRFYRDPERIVPQVEGAIVSPADGEIIYIRRSRGSFLPVSTKQGRQYTLHELMRSRFEHEDCIVVGIAMNYLDVHVNRSPLSGTIVLRRHFPGRFGSLRDPAMVFENERATTIIRNEQLEIAVVQIASRLVRQIVSYVNPGQAVAAGERLGAIRLGSQVDLVLPSAPQLTLRIKVGDKVIAGESIIGMLASAPRVPNSTSKIEETVTR